MHQLISEHPHETCLLRDESSAWLGQKVTSAHRGHRALQDKEERKVLGMRASVQNTEMGKGGEEWVEGTEMVAEWLGHETCEPDRKKKTKYLRIS